MVMFFSDGQVVLTKRGIKTTPFPRVDCSTNRRTINTIKRQNKWLLDNARMVADKTNDSWGLLLLKNMDVKNLSPADQDHLHVYLFGEI